MSVWGAPKAAAEEADAAPSEFPTLGGAKEAFPSLGMAAQVKVSKKKQKQTMSLADFNAGGPSATPTRAAGSAYRAPVGRSGGDDNFVLPTGPRAREDEEAAMGGALGGAFRDYGGDRGEGGKYGARGGFEERDGPRRGGGGYDDEMSGPPREADGPSRADEDRDWGASKKFVPTAPGERRAGGGGFERRGDEREGDRGGERAPPGEPLGPSRADEDRNWGASKRFTPSEVAPPRDARDGPPPGPSRADEDRNWGASKRYEPGGGASMGTASREPPRRDGGDPDSADRWARRGGDAAPAERPRLQLKPRAASDGEAPADAPAAAGATNIFGAAKPVAVREAPDVPIVAPPTRGPERDQWTRAAPADAPPAPEASRGERPSERPKLQLAPKRADSDASGAASSSSSSVFGGARPRELALAEHGRDWRVEDLTLEHKAAARAPTAEEKALAAQVAEAKAAAAAAEAGSEAAQQAAAKATELELALAKLTLAVDDKARFVQHSAAKKEQGAKEPAAAKEAKPAAEAANGNGKAANGAADGDKAAAPAAPAAAPVTVPAPPPAAPAWGKKTEAVA